jgi:hypothetical protein
MTDTEPETPPAPTGVWLEYADGARYTNVPTVYAGRDEKGVAIFEVLAPRDDAPVAAGMEKLPGMTSVAIPALRPKDPE